MNNRGQITQVHGVQRLLLLVEVVAHCGCSHDEPKQQHEVEQN